MDDATFYKGIESTKESTRYYSTNREIISAISAHLQRATTEEQRAICRQFLQIATIYKVHTLLEIAMLSAKEQLQLHHHLERAMPLLHQSLLNSTAQSLLDKYFDIDEEERTALSKQALEDGLNSENNLKLMVNVVEDDKTCHDCLNLQGQIFELWQNPLPHHPNCRCQAQVVNDIDGYVTGTVASCQADGTADVVTADGVHLILDLLGFMPVVGVASDVTNALIYISEKDYVNALLSGISAIPLVGLVTGVIKTVKSSVKIIKVVYKGGDTVELIRNGKVVQMPISRIVNFKYAGKTYHLSGDLAQKYPNGVKFSKAGFPDFSPYCIKEVKVADLTGSRPHDARLANQQAGFDKTPANYEWHHVEDGVTMQLVPQDLHQKVRHTGGVSLIKYLNQYEGME